MLRIMVITLSDRAAAGAYEDQSGPLIEEHIRTVYPDADIQRLLIPDNKDDLLKAFAANRHQDWIITTGGTGIGSRDITPQITEEFCTYALPGIAEALRAESYKETPNAMLSRGWAGMIDSCIIVNFPGSAKAVACCIQVLLPILSHAPDMITGKGH